jgi:predicted DNA-binding transcriptional regulator AlpA
VVTATKRKPKDSVAPAAFAAALGATIKPPDLGGKLLLSFADLRALGVSYSRWHLYRLVREDKFPRPVALGPEPCTRKAWRAADIERWLAERPYYTSAAE